MNRAQRIILVVALGVALLVAAVVVNLLMLARFDGGWFAYVPSSPVTTSDNYFTVTSDRAIMRQGLVWLAALALWTGVSLWLLRTPREDR